jgi:hypothetical protein
MFMAVCAAHADGSISQAQPDCLGCRCRFAADTPPPLIMAAWTAQRHGHSRGSFSVRLGERLPSALAELAFADMGAWTTGQFTACRRN